MTLDVYCCCTYRTSPPRLWTDRDFAACKLIRALKGEPLSGWANIPVARERIRLDASNSATAVDVFGRLVAASFHWPSRLMSLVPIPNSLNTVFSDSTPRTKTLADALSRHAAAPSDLNVADVLRWREPMPSAHAWASARYPEQLYPNLRLIRALQWQSPVLLVDDLLTTGGHMRAAAAFLEDQGATVFGGVCAGRSDAGAVTDAFAVRIERLESFTYDPSVFDDWPEQTGPDLRV